MNIKFTSICFSSFLADSDEHGRDEDFGVDMGDFPKLGNFHSYEFRFFRAIFEKKVFLIKIFNVNL